MVNWTNPSSCAESKDLAFAYLSAGLRSSPCCFTTPVVGYSQTMTSGGLKHSIVQGSFDFVWPAFRTSHTSLR
jgi:hypothetical protein